MGTRFIATTECDVPLKYKETIVSAKKEDIVYSLNLTGVKVSVINTAYIQRLGLKPNALVLWMLSNNFFKHFVRLFYMIRSLKKLKASVQTGKDEFFQAGKSVEGIVSIKSVHAIIEDFCN